MLMLLALMAQGGCSRTESPRAAAQTAQTLPIDTAPETSSRRVAVDINVPESALEPRFHLLVDRCTGDALHHCTLLESELSSGAVPSARLRLRVDPESTEELITYAVSLGRLQHRSTTAEDLTPVIEEAQTRLAMLTAYRKQLLELQSRAATNVEAAIKIAAELANVQTQLEQMQAEAAAQKQRTQADLVTIQLLVPPHRALGPPIREAIDTFFGNMSIAIGQVITALAYILPWACIVVPALLGLRLLWRRAHIHRIDRP